MTGVVATSIQDAKQHVLTAGPRVGHHGGARTSSQVLGKLLKLGILDLASSVLSSEVVAIAVLSFCDHAEGLALLLSIVQDLCIPCGQVLR